jgi:RTX calcium-binding nonapeptide repeat (4 copies)
MIGRLGTLGTVALVAVVATALALPATSVLGGTTTTGEGELECAGVPATIEGTTGDDDLTGTDGDDVVVLRIGLDTFTGRAGGDLICGGGGKDTLRGGAGDDDMYGGADRDEMYGRSGTDFFELPARRVEVGGALQGEVAKRGSFAPKDLCDGGRPKAAPNGKDPDRANKDQCEKIVKARPVTLD